MKNVILYFGSFDPIHKGHIALAEYVVEQGLCDEVVLVVSPQNPLKDKVDITPEMNRFEMAEIACKNSKYPDKIKPSVIEFLLDKPSYTINTLRHLSKDYGDKMCFSILMGGDLVGELDKWRDYEEILENYRIYVYPRNKSTVDKYLDKIVYLDKAPTHNFSSTEIRESLEHGDDVGSMLDLGVMQYIREKGLWSAANMIVSLTTRIDLSPNNALLYVERGKLHYRNNEWGSALNDFNKAITLDPQHIEATQFIDMIQEILAFRYKDIYNP